MEEGVAQHPVESKESSLTWVLVDDGAMAIYDSTVSEPGW